MLKDYAKRNGFLNCQFYVDDGYSGANYDRPTFRQLIEAALSAVSVSSVIPSSPARCSGDFPVYHRPPPCQRMYIQCHSLRQQLRSLIWFISIYVRVIALSVVPREIFLQSAKVSANAAAHTEWNSPTLQGLLSIRDAHSPTPEPPSARHCYFRSG